MADYHQIVEQIRAFLQSSDQTRNERLEGLASAYAEHCADANQRLGRCQRLLQQGLRSEAIQLAESEPRLLDAIVALDFPERPQWDDLVGIYDLAAAPRIMVEAGVGLNDAYAQEQPLQELLRNHRRLATQRAPLRQRIGVMRKLAAQDPNNSIWVDDLRTFEKARFRQIQAEAAEAAALDSADIGRLLAEVQDPGCIEPAPKGLVQGLKKADSQLRGQQAALALVELEGRLGEALEARDAERGRAVRHEWVARIATAPPEPGDSIWQRVGPALAWLDEEDHVLAAAAAHEQSVAALAAALDDPAFISAAELERLEREVVRHGRGIPDKLQRRCATRIRAATTARARLARRIAAVAGVGLLCAAGLAFYLVRGYLRAGDAGQAATAVGAYLDSGDLDQAARFIENLEKSDPDLLAEPRVQEVRRRYQELRDKETERARKFEEARSAADRADPITADSKDLDAARALARLESETQEIELIGQRRAAAVKAAHEKNEQTLTPKLEAISQALDQIERQMQAGSLDQPALAVALQNNRHSLSELEPSLAKAGDDLQGRARRLGNRLHETSIRFDELERRSGLQEKITSAVSYSVTDRSDRLGLFASQLEEFVKSFPGEPCTKAFQKTLRERPLWESIAAWNQLVSGWTHYKTGLRADEAARRAAACGQFLARYAQFPGAPEVLEYQKYAELVALRASAAGDPIAKLQRLFASTVVEHIWMVALKSSAQGPILHRYYAIDQPREKDESVSFNSIFNTEGKAKSRFLPSGSSFTIDLSPQSKIAERFKQMVATGPKERPCELTIIELVDVILAQPDIDPILQLLLLKNVVDAGTKASEPLRASFNDLKNELDGGRVDLKINWIDPETPRLANAQDEAERLVKSLRSKVPKAETVLRHRDQIEQNAAKTYHTVGLLASKGIGFELQKGVAVPRDGELLVAVPSGSSRGEWKKVGNIVEGKPSIDTRDSSALAEGRPVFVVAGPSS